MAKRQTSSSPEALRREVVDLLRDLAHALFASSVPVWLDLQLTLPQLRTAFLIAHHGTSSVMQVSQRLGVGEPTASHLIDKLVVAGLVQRSEDPRDRRRARVQLTTQGEQLIERLLGWEEFLGRWLQQVADQDLALLRRGLEAIVEQLPAQALSGKQASHQEDKGEPFR